MKSYLIDPTQLVSTSQGLIRSERIQPEALIKNLSGVQKVLEINKVERLVKQITFKNGWTTFLDLKTNVQTPEGLISVAQVKEGSLLNFCFFNYFNSEKDTLINWTDRKMAVPIRIPKVLTPDFAYWIGIVTAQSKSSINHRHIQIEIKKEGPLKEIFTSLTKKLFNLTVDEVNEGNRKFLQINSSNLVKFLQHNVGRRLMVFRKVPIFIQEADILCQMAYVRGLSLKGHVDGTKYVVYAGSSKSISEFVASFLISIGYGVYRKIKNLGNKKVYVIMISYCHKDSVRIDSEFIKGPYPINEQLESNPEFKQNYMIPINSFLSTIDSSKVKILELKEELSWKLNLLKEEQKIEKIRTKRELKKLRRENVQEFTLKINELTLQHKEQKGFLINSYKEMIDKLKRTNFPGYKSLMKAKERKQNFILADSINDPLFLDSIEYLVKVKEVKILKKEMIELVVSADAGMFVDGLIIQ